MIIRVKVLAGEEEVTREFVWTDLLEVTEVIEVGDTRVELASVNLEPDVYPDVEPTSSQGKKRG